MFCYHSINLYIYVYYDNNVCMMSCVCACYMTDRGMCKRGGGGGGLTAMQRRQEKECILYVWRGEQYAEMRGGWKQNRTALTTEPKDKEKIEPADRRDCLGAWSCYMKGDRKITVSVWQPKAL